MLAPTATTSPPSGCDEIAEILPTFAASQWTLHINARAALESPNEMTDCVILAIASTTETVRALLQRLVKDVVLDEHASTVPWTIVNKYYTAEVKFLIHPLSSWAAIQDEFLGPALLFVWNRGEPYRDQIRRLSQHASQHEFEVALAIRLPPSSSTSPAEVEDDQDIDAYLSSKGFEFVDVPGMEASSPDRFGILGIPRIVDALSTIMWPSMVRQTSGRVTTTKFIGAVQRNPGMSSDEYHDLVRLVGEKISGNDSDRVRRELEELECWLDEDTFSGSADARSARGEDEAIPWSTVVTPGTLSPSSSGFLESSRPTTPKAGFDDDFISSVSALSPNSAGIPQASLEGLSSPHGSPPPTSTNFSTTFNFNSTLSGRSTPTFDDHTGPDATRLAPGEPYKSLGSVSDFGDLDKELVDLERLSNGSDEDMPSQAEIVETSRKIFSTIPLSLSPAQERNDGSLHALNALGGLPSRGNPSEEFDVEMTDVNLERFDLQSVLGALQGLKEEIAGMPDKERRKAAARVALGLAYGLDSNLHSEASEEPV
ncbi:hypothetical protein HD554DRAFT_908662 [Boletus coccyginus]|nr:hypothetical protein HD554DRAFT_908662 [Boletus coccyginus]